MNRSLSRQQYEAQHRMETIKEDLHETDTVVAMRDCPWVGAVTPQRTGKVKEIIQKKQRI